MSDSEFRLFVAQNAQWAIHERNWHRAGGNMPGNNQPRPPHDVVKLWEMVAPSTRDFFELVADIAIGLCAERQKGNL